VPDRQVITALELAGLRGVDVRILIPDEPGHLGVYLAALSYLDESGSGRVRQEAVVVPLRGEAGPADGADPVEKARGHEPLRSPARATSPPAETLFMRCVRGLGQPQ